MIHQHIRDIKNYVDNVDYASVMFFGLNMNKKKNG